MNFEPDIIVTEEDSSRWRLIVEAKLDFDDRKQAELVLKRYMLGMGAPLGLIISPSRLAIYRDRFTDYSENSVELVGDFDIPANQFGARRSTEAHGNTKLDLSGEFAFQRDVQTWLEELASTHKIRGFSPEAREALEEHVLPTLAGGAIRAAGPRELRAS